MKKEDKKPSLTFKHSAGPQISVEEFQAESHLPFIQQWWKKQNWPGLPANMLPHGYVSFIGEVPTAAAFVIGTDGALFVMEWIVGNPDVGHLERGAGIEEVVRACLLWSAKQGAAAVITTTKHERLIERYENMGFQKTDEGMTHLVIDLGKDFKITAPEGAQQGDKEC